MSAVPVDDPLAKYTAEFCPDTERMLAAILFLMNLKPGITQYQIVKSVFLADKAHLNECGRPITYDKYVAMEQGPVPSLVLSLLKDASLFRTIYHRDPPWTTKPRANGKGIAFTASEQGDGDMLSLTDTDALRLGLATVRKLSQAELKRLLHEDPAYTEAWERRDKSGSVAMNPVLLLGDRNEETISLLSELCLA